MKKRYKLQDKKRLIYQNFRQRKSGATNNKGGYPREKIFENFSGNDPSRGKNMRKIRI
jgi:hypothetical protein